MPRLTMTDARWLPLALSALVLGACGGGDDGVSVPPPIPMPDAMPPPDADIDAAPEPAPTTYRFTVRIENLSDQSALPSPLSPGFWALHPAAEALFREGQPDLGFGLEDLAEDGDPIPLSQADMPSSSLRGVFNELAPVTASAQTQAQLPGEAIEFSFETPFTEERFSLATMFVHSNDLFVANQAGIALFEQGEPIPSQDVTAAFALWDLGTEANQAPGSGPNQPQQQLAPAQGSPESVIRPFSDTTRAMAPASALVDVSVSETEGSYEITLTNISKQTRTLVTAISPLFYALHNDTWSLFTEGTAEAAEGLEALAEQGDAAPLIDGLDGVGGLLRFEVSDTGAGIDVPNNSLTFAVTPKAVAPYLTIAALVVESYDAFLALPPAGVRLLEEGGDLRPAEAIEAEIERLLAVWDAGTEANQAPGIGPNQAPRQADTGTPGGPDADPTVRRYADAGNDLAPDHLPEILAITVAHSASEQLGFDVTVTNLSDQSQYPTPLSPPFWILHNGEVPLYQQNLPGSLLIEKLAEDGDASTFNSIIGSAPGVLDNNVEEADGDGTPTVAPGESVTFPVTPDADHGQFNLMSMIVHSNDTFVALGPLGIDLLDASGERRSADDVNADIATALGAWDAGTELNQSGGGGGDQASRQTNPNTGAPEDNIGAREGNGTVRDASENPVWVYPPLEQIVRITITGALAE